VLDVDLRAADVGSLDRSGRAWTGFRRTRAVGVTRAFLEEETSTRETNDVAIVRSSEAEATGSIAAPATSTSASARSAGSGRGSGGNEGLEGAYALITA
jgi:hypothetical protein